MLVLSEREGQWPAELPVAVGVRRSTCLGTLVRRPDHGGLPDAGVVALTSNSDINDRGQPQQPAATSDTYVCGEPQPR